MTNSNCVRVGLGCYLHEKSKSHMHNSQILSIPIMHLGLGDITTKYSLQTHIPIHMFTAMSFLSSIEFSNPSSSDHHSLYSSRITILEHLQCSQSHMEGEQKLLGFSLYHSYIDRIPLFWDCNLILNSVCGHPMYRLLIPYQRVSPAF